MAGILRRCIFAFGTWIVAAIALSGCSARSTSEVIKRADDILRSNHSQSAEVELASLLGYHSGLVCIVLGELDELRFSRSAQSWVSNPRIERQLRAAPQEHMFVSIHVINREGQLVRSLRVHRRNRHLDIDTPTGADLDACFTIDDRVWLRRGNDDLIMVRFELEGIATDD